MGFTLSVFDMRLIVFGVSLVCSDGLYSAKECVDNFPFWEDMSAPKLSATTCTIPLVLSKTPVSVDFLVAASAADFLTRRTYP